MATQLLLSLPDFEKFADDGCQYWNQWVSKFERQCAAYGLETRIAQIFPMYLKD